jgi:hypothetical protein
MRSGSRGLDVVGILAVTLLASLPARADSPIVEDLRAQADAAFDEGKQLMDSGQPALACDKFARSQRLDPRLGRLLNLAFCHEVVGKTASAWREYNDAMALADQKGQTEREDFARERAAAIVKNLSFVRFDIPENAVALEVDGAWIARDRWATPMPLDPGDHKIVVSAPGKTTRRTAVMVGESPGMQLVAIGPLGEDSLAIAGDSPPPGRAETGSSPATANGPPASPRRGASRLPVFVAGGVAAAGLIVGAAFGVEVLVKKSDADGHCEDKVCDTRGWSLVSDAKSAATVSTVGFGVAAVGAAVAASLLLLAPRRPPSAARFTPLVGPRMAGIDMRLAW